MMPCVSTRGELSFNLSRKSFFSQERGLLQSEHTVLLKIIMGPHLGTYRIYTFLDTGALINKLG
jgi:hypothetical protein